jgi:hypothetical protein
VKTVDKCPFPPQEYSCFRGSKYWKQPRIPEYIGTWKIKTALKIALQLRRDGFKVRVRGRGPRRIEFEDVPIIREYNRSFIALCDATHGAIYIIAEDICYELTEAKKNPRISGVIENI